MGSLKILHVMASHRWTGAAEPAAHEAAAVRELGHEVLFALTCGSSFEAKLRELGVPVTDRIPFERSYWPHRKLREIHLLQALVRDFQPDVVHAHLTHDHILAGVALGKADGSGPVIVRTWRREQPPRADAFTRNLVTKRTVGGLTVSTGMKQRLHDAFGFPDDMVRVMPTMLDVDRFQPGAGGARMREKWGIPADAPVVGSISRLRPSRGIPWMLRAATQFLAEMPEARLVLCGRGSWRDEMLDEIAAHPHKDRIVYAGFVEGEDLVDSYRAFDVALLLRPGNDGGCRAALEANACGTPVIGGDLGVLHDLYADGVAGWLAKPDDDAALADLIVKALEDRGATARRGEAARERILARHTRGKMAQSLAEFYQAAVSRAARADK